MAVAKYSVMFQQTFDDGEFEGLPDLLTINPTSLDLSPPEVKHSFQTRETVLNHISKEQENS